MSGNDIVIEMLELNYVEEQVRYALRHLAARRLIETPHGHYRELKVEDRQLPEEFLYRVTSIGVYHIRFWMGTFSFLDATSTDTPIFDAHARRVVFDLASSFVIKDRSERAEMFRTYLEEQWHAANINRPYLDLITAFQSQSSSLEAVRRIVAEGGARPAKRAHPLQKKQQRGRSRAKRRR